ncbi:cytochrome c oxidase assembly protein [Mesorhizobium microcysteis]|uniref:Cytochrome c oxidase assembly protein CtaG n=1 Tax=Neoaquamicrobium microcysteis TaxID=2682781 RepID=A0A5D4GU38_9HYPH|nr:cytochrome c oxidase assembly protein [Mesorhizobium microcysteis]TYR31877.1 cytochrome c oxidase assembly protein [Mesorhizobium microcysteis]
MSQTDQTRNEQTDRSNRRVAVACVAFFASMVGMAYAAVPLYEMFCQITGYGGTTQRVEQYSQTVLDRDIKVRFDANVSGGLPWDFKPVSRDVTLKIGETTQVSYSAKNTFSQPTSGRASFNVTPQMAGAYFMKVECFCFTDTELQPGEDMDMPVVFYVDPEIVNVPELKNIGTITLSYTFFPLDHAKPLESAAAPAGTNSNTDADTEFGG